MRPVSRSYTSRASTTSGAVAPSSVPPNGSSLHNWDSKPAAKTQGPSSLNNAVSNVQGEDAKPEAKTAGPLEAPAPSIKRPRFADEMLFRGRRPVQAPEVVQAEKDIFPMDDGWETLEIFDSLGSDFLEGAESTAGISQEFSPTAQRELISQSISQSVLEIQTAERMAIQHPSLAVVNQAVRMAIGVAARFAEEQAEAVKNEHNGLVELIDVQRKCNAAKDAVLAAAGNAFDTEKMLQTRRKVLDAVNLGGQTPAQAAAAVSVDAVRSVLAYPDISEVVQVSAAAAASALLVVLSQAFHLSPSNKQEIAQSIREAVRQRPDGKIVLAFLAGVGNASAPP